MPKPVYKYPDFVTKVELNKTEDKRYWLKLQIDKTKKETFIVILKNPSRADSVVSDKTVFNVSSYIYKNKDKYSVFKDVGYIVILNLIPHYQTYSDQLKSLKSAVICSKNMTTIDSFTKRSSNVIIAWGNHPPGLYHEYEEIKTDVFNTLKINGNNIMYVDKLSDAGNPKHGQVWGYNNKLKSYI